MRKKKELEEVSAIVEQQNLSEQKTDKSAEGELTREIEINESTERKFAPSDFQTVQNKYKRYTLLESRLRNKLIGTYKNKKYYIQDDLAHDLLKMRKKTITEGGNKLTCTSTYNDFVFNFELTYETYATYSTAKLFLIEDEISEKEDSKIKTIVGYEVFPSKPGLLETIKKLWNIDQQDREGEAFQLDILNSILTGVIKEYQINSELLDVLAHIYVINILELLGKEEFGKRVIEQYNAYIAAVGEKDPLIFKDYAKLKKILDQIMDENKTVFMLQKTHPEELANIYKNFYEPLERINPNFAKDDDEAAADPTYARREKVEIFEEVRPKIEAEIKKVTPVVPATSKTKTAARPAPAKAAGGGAKKGGVSKDGAGTPTASGVGPTTPAGKNPTTSTTTTQVRQGGRNDGLTSQERLKDALINKPKVREAQGGVGVAIRDIGQESTGIKNGSVTVEGADAGQSTSTTIAEGADAQLGDEKPKGVDALNKVIAGESSESRLGKAFMPETEITEEELLDALKAKAKALGDDGPSAQG